jgi:hypothetical protein
VQQYQNVIQDKFGNVIVGASVAVYVYGTTTPATIYSGNGSGVLPSNTVTTNSLGEFAFYAANGRYSLSVSATNFVLENYSDFILYDPADIGAVTASGVAFTPFGTIAATNVQNAIQEVVSDLSGSTGSSLVGFLQSGTGAVSRTVQAKERDFVSVKDFGAVGDGTTDDTVAIQAAINSGYSLVFPAGTYKCANLTQSTSFQRFYAAGNVTLQKNANGPILTSSGSDVEFNGIGFRGESATPSFTGNNFVSSGANLRLINCGSRWAYARAVLATGNHVQIIGTCDLYQTTDSSATGYDIEIGVSGTATLYHELIGVYSSQNTGGIKLIDVGAHTIHGGEFGKLYIAAGTSPVGVNGGKTIGARILGNVTVEISSAIFSANQFGTVTITFAVGTSGCSLDQSNAMTTATIVNNGNGNSPIIKSTGTGSPSGIVLQYGHDTGNSTIRYGVDEIYLEDSNLFLANNKAVKFADSTGTYYTALSINASDDWTIGANNGANFSSVNGGSGGVYLGVGGVSIMQAYTAGIRPQTDNSYNCGTSTQRWAQTFSTNFRPGAGTATWTSGTGAPEGSLTATVGSLYTRTDGGATTTLYVKESGTGNTGWVAK